MERLLNRARTVGLRVAAGLVLSAGSGAALGQTALGNGQGLYNDLLRRNSMAASGRDYAAEARNRNAIVFGRAPGGLSFQGGLGYKDPGEFMGTLGSNSLQSFNASAAMSGLTAQNIRATQALDQQRALAVGAPRRPGFQGSLETPRAPTSSGGNLSPGYRDSAGLLRVDPLADRREQGFRPGNALSSRRPGLGNGDYGGGTRGSGLGSGSSFGMGSSRASQTGDYGSGLSDRLGVTGRLGGRVSEIAEADPTYGTDALKTTRTLAGADRARQGQQRLAEDATRARTQSATGRPSDIIDNRAPGSGLDLRAQMPAPELATAYDQLKANLDKQMGPVGAPAGAERGGSELGKNTGSSWEQIEKLKTTLRVDPDRGVSFFGRGTRESPLAAIRAGEKGAPTRKAKSTEITLPERMVDQGKEGEDGKDDAARLKWLDPKTLKIIRDAAVRVENLAPTGAPSGRDFFVEHMKIGEAMLGQGRFFDAEERFMRALAVKPGDVMAQVGRIHSELGAGLLLSAGQNLRRLLSSHPETAGLKYAPALLPPPDRRDAIVEQLRENLGGQGRIRRESALLLAYMGFQTQDEATTRAGINAVAAVAEQDPEAMSAGDARLAELLRGIWLDPSLNPRKDAPTPEK